jgi:hypothetical protein
MIRMTIATIVLAGCGASSDQTVTGRVANGSFPEPITRVRAVGTASVVEAPVGADGTFSIRVAAQDRYRLELHSGTRQSDLVFPRASGVIHTTFFVENGGAAIELGNVRYVRDPANATYDFNCKSHPEGGGVCVEDGDGGGKACGGDVGAPEGGAVGESGDGAVAEANPPEAVGCEGDGDGEGGGGEGDGEGGGEGCDTGEGGGGDTGGGGQDEGPNPCGDGRCL